MPTFLVHVVAAGESLNTIAHRFGTTARSIAFWNRSTYPSLDPDSTGYRPDLLKVGWTLFLIPNAVVDEQDLREPSTDPAEDP
ncbi:MAG: LysM domain-containing protein, partial [Candidatus Limnocylindrales bacterium]